MRNVAALALALALTACTGTRKLTDPVVAIMTDRGMELGVSTEFGVVFLGKTADRGPVIVEAYFGDGPSMEQSVIEPVGGGLYTADMEIRLPHVPISFDLPTDGETLEVMGRRGWDRWSTMTTCRIVEGVEGVLVEIPEGFLDSVEQTGAGVYRPTGEFTKDLWASSLARSRSNATERAGSTSPSSAPTHSGASPLTARTSSVAGPSSTAKTFCEPSR